MHLPRHQLEATHPNNVLSPIVDFLVSTQSWQATLGVLPGSPAGPSTLPGLCFLTCLPPGFPLLELSHSTEILLYMNDHRLQWALSTFCFSPASPKDIFQAFFFWAPLSVLCAFPNWGHSSHAPKSQTSEPGLRPHTKASFDTTSFSSSQHFSGGLSLVHQKMPPQAASTSTLQYTVYMYH